MPKEIMENKVFRGEDFAKEPLGKVTFDQCDFFDCGFAAADLSGSNFEECCFKNCIFDRVNLRETRFTDCVFDGCKMLGVDFALSNSFNFSVNFRDCQLDYSTFVGMRLCKINFESCRLLEVDFSLADLSEAVFEECDLSAAIFEDANLEKADFTKAKNYDIDLNNNRVRGAKFSRSGIDGLLRKYKLKIQD